VDTDAGGRIHFTAVFRWVEAAETALMRRLDLLESWGNYPRRHVQGRHTVVHVDEHGRASALPEPVRAALT